MRKDIEEIKIDAKVEKIDWHKEWEELKNNKIVIALAAVSARIYKKVKGAKDEKNEKGNK